MANRKMKLDFTGVESFLRANEGEHVCKIVSADLKQSSGGNDMIVVAFEVTKGDDKGARVYENYPLVETALWKLKGLLQAIGMKADGKVQLDLDKLVGKVCVVNVKHEEYDGKTRARVESVMKFNAATADNEDDDEDFEEEEEQEEKPAKTKATSKKKPDINPPKDEDDDDDDDWDDEEEDEEEPEEKPKKKSKEKSEAKAKADKKPAKKAKAAEDDDDDDWDDDDWDE